MRVSIITVCYNSESTIEDTICSIVNQTYSDIEYIIIDGQSTDGTLSIIKKYDKHINTILSEKDKGMYDAINKGINLATGNVIGILNADDFYIDNNVIKEVAECFLATNAQGLYADLYYVDSANTEAIKRYWKSGKYRHGIFTKGWMPPHPTFFLKKEAYDKFGHYDLSFVTAADYELMLRMIHKHKIGLAYLNRVIVKMRVGGMSNSSIKNRLRANREDKKAWQVNNLRPMPYTFLFKPLRKIKQFFR